MFPAGKKDAGDAVEYDGGRNSDSIVAWALDKLAENVPPPEVVEVGLLLLTCEDLDRYVTVTVGLVEIVGKTHPTILLSGNSVIRGFYTCIFIFYCTELVFYENEV